jgi:hypothetical protein
LEWGQRREGLKGQGEDTMLRYTDKAGGQGWYLPLDQKMNLGHSRSREPVSCSTGAGDVRGRNAEAQYVLSSLLICPFFLVCSLFWRWELVLGLFLQLYFMCLINKPGK